MVVNKRNVFFFASAALIAALWQFGPLPDAGNRLDRFSAVMKQGGSNFRAQPLPKTEAERAVYGAARVVKEAVAVRGEEPFRVTVIDGSRNRHAIHAPAYCFRGAGWQIVAQSDLPLSARFWMQTALRRMTRGHTGSEPVLVVLEPLAGGAAPPDWRNVTAFEPLEIL